MASGNVNIHDDSSDEDSKDEEKQGHKPTSHKKDDVTSHADILTDNMDTGVGSVNEGKLRHTHWKGSQTSAKSPKEERTGPDQPISKQIKTISFTGLEAQQILTFFVEKLQDENIHAEVSKLEGKGEKYVKLSSSNPTLLATKKQELEGLLETIKCEEIEINSQKLQDVDREIKSKKLLVLSDYKNGKLNVYYTEKSEYEKIIHLIKPSKRRDRTFQFQMNDINQSEPLQGTAPGVYKGPSKWQSATAPSSFSATSNNENTGLADLGKKVELKKEFEHNGICTKIYQGSITRANVDAIVNAANERLDNCGGVAEVISKAAGKEMEYECKGEIRKRSKIKVSENVLTNAGNLPCRWIIHAVGPRWSDYTDKEKALESLYQTVINILKTACDHTMKSVVMPPISSGIFGVPKEACAAMYVKALLDFSEQYRGSSLREFHIIDIKSDVLDFICTEYDESCKKGNEYLAPSRVIERCGIQTRSTFWPIQNVSKINSANHIQNGSTKPKEYWRLSPNCGIREIGEGKFIVGGKLNVLVYTESILDLKNVSILVCAEGREAKISGRIAKTVMEKASKAQQKQIESRLIRFKQYSDVLQTDFGINDYKMIFFAIMRRFGDKIPRRDDFILLKNTTVKVLEAANKNKTKRNKSDLSVAIPLLGTGSTLDTTYLQQYADAVCDCILNFSKQISDSTRLKTIHLVNFHQPQTAALNTALKNRCILPTHGPGDQSPSGRKDKYYNHGSTRPQFDPSKYKKQEVWETVANSQSDFESFIEKVKGTPQAAQKTSDGSKIAGNIVIIDSDEEEDKGAKAKQDVDEEESVLSMCIICMDDKMENPVMLKNCKHKFCRNCIEEYFSQKPVCPVCSTVYGEIFGNQPPGNATVYLDRNSLPGYDCSTIIIHYEIPDGMQTNEHPNPDVPFTGLSRQGYLPDNSEGKAVLGLLKKAFEHRLIFTVGVSRSSGKDNVVTWNDIHHKTRRDGGPEKFGYPDEEYLERVKEELAAKGINND